MQEFVDRALELTRPVGGMVALLVNIQWPTGATNSTRCRMPAFDMEIKLIGRIAWFAGPDGKPAKQPQENDRWLIWDWSRTPASPECCSPARTLNPNRKRAPASCAGSRFRRRRAPMPDGARQHAGNAPGAAA